MPHAIITAHLQQNIIPCSSEISYLTGHPEILLAKYDKPKWLFSYLLLGNGDENGTFLK